MKWDGIEQAKQIEIKTVKSGMFIVYDYINNPRYRVYKLVEGVKGGVEMIKEYLPPHYDSSIIRFRGLVLDRWMVITEDI
jgi:hypothetical protein